MKTFFICAVLALCATVVLSARIGNCGSLASIDIRNTNITGCTKRSRTCTFIKGQEAELSIPFTPKTSITSLKAVVHGIIAGIPVPFSLPEPEACGKSLKCPVASGTKVFYHEGLPVKTQYPSLSLTVKWELVDQNNKKQVCLLIPVTLKN